MSDGTGALAHQAEAGGRRPIVRMYFVDFITKMTPVFGIGSLLRYNLPHGASSLSAVKKGARAREYENALRWLHDAGLVHLCHAVSTSRSPLMYYADRRCFKVFAPDVGLLGAMAAVPQDLAVQGERLFTEYRGALAESYVAQQLVAAGHPDLYYWRSPGGKAELDFLCELGGTIVPVEVKAELSLRSKSLRSYDQQLAPPVLVRTNLLNLKRDGKICNIPLYAVSWLSRFVKT